jgi:hypothetical protein
LKQSKYWKKLVGDRKKMKRKSLILGAMVVIAMIVASFALPVMASEGEYKIDCREVVKYSRCVPQCDNPTIITQGYDDNGEMTMTITTSVPDEYYRSELGTICCSLEEHRVAEQTARGEIMTNTDVTVDFYVYGVEYYPCTVNRRTGEISITLTGDDMPLPGDWVGLRFCNVECDTYDKTVYAPLPGTLLNEFKVPAYGDEIPLTVLGFSPIY